MKKCCFALGLISFLLHSCGKKTEQYTVNEAPITESVYASGIIKSKNQYQVFSKTNGLVEEVFVEEGALIQKGDAILRLSNPSSRLNTANSRLALELANQNARGEKLKELQVGIELAKNKYLNDSLLWLRQKSLWEQKIGTQVELEQRELAFKTSQSNYRSALLRYADTKKTLDFQSEQALNNSRISESMEDDFIIRSETNGRLFNLLKEKGEMVTNMSPIATIGDDKAFIIELQVDEYDITRLETGQTVLVSLDSYKGRVFEGRVSKINRIMDERSRTFKIEAEFTNAPETLYPNLSVEANIVIQSKSSALLVPRNYLIADSFVLNPDKDKVPVITGLKDYNKVEILRGLKKGDVILKPGP
ncbi:MAG: efflux RND transporter periplasmic adaptor subunit [Bacteroidia bacterium]|nr:efflux RND transporter periplasmic adaptor subunit [Bacteroidia bacterium]